MSGRPQYGLSFDPRALSDLLQAPGDIRDLALSHLQDVVAGEVHGSKLTGDLSGYRKLLIDRLAQYRLVYAQRPAPTGGTHPTEIHVMALRPRADHDVYDTVAARLGMNHRPVSAATHAARARSPQLDAQRPVPKPAPPAPRIPSPSVHPKGPVR
ncbi:hypothetical protein AN219_37420 [Streptomyces nanshensis]|nr:hypothetical protein AN219_37420 [Streptomyces nanshensis]